MINLNGEKMTEEKYIERQKNELLFLHKQFNESSKAQVKQWFCNQITKVEMELVNNFGLTWSDMEDIEMKSYSI